MKPKAFGCVLAVGLAMIAGCSKSNPAAPSEKTTAAASEDVAAAITGSVTVPQPVSPAANAQIRNVDQPVTLTVVNAIATKGTNTYDFEVATDTAFASKVSTKSGVAEGTGGRTSVTLDRLAPAADYYWHARAQGGGTTGPFTAARKFSIGPAVTIDTPAIIGPLSGAQTNARPALRVKNATRQGPAGPITYKFDISTTSTFTPILMTATQNEGVNETGFIPAAELPIEATFFWRVTAIDVTNAVSSAPTAPQSFTTALAIDLTRVVFLKGPNLSTWKETGTIISVEQDGNPATGGLMCISFTDPGWPDVKWPYGGDDPNFGVYGNQWYFARIGGTWYGGPGEWLYRGAAVCKAGQGTRTIGPDSGFGQPFSSWVPRPGELVGYAVSASARAYPAMFSVAERTNVVVQPWHDSSLQPIIGFKRP